MKRYHFRPSAMLPVVESANGEYVRHADIEPLLARLAEAERLLRQMEWCIGRDSAGTCAICRRKIGLQSNGHAPDCALARWLGGGDKPC